MDSADTIRIAQLHRKASRQGRLNTVPIVRQRELMFCSSCARLSRIAFSVVASAFFDDACKCCCKA